MALLTHLLHLDVALRKSLMGLAMSTEGRVPLVVFYSSVPVTSSN